MIDRIRDAIQHLQNQIAEAGYDVADLEIRLPLRVHIDFHKDLESKMRTLADGTTKTDPLASIIFRFPHADVLLQKPKTESRPHIMMGTPEIIERKPPEKPKKMPPKNPYSEFQEIFQQEIDRL